MHDVAVINTQSGTIRSADIEDLCSQIAAHYAGSSRRLEIIRTAGENLPEELHSAASNPEVGRIFALGGDGTISLAAAHCFRHEKTLGVLPGGTMNLIAKSLGLPAKLERAVADIPTLEPTKIDVARMDEQIFLHQLSFGLQPELVERRQDFDYVTRVGKIAAGVGATLGTVSNLETTDATLSFDDITVNVQTGMMAISTNPHAEGHLPFADGLQAGQLGVYWSNSDSAAGHAKLISDLLMGSWSGNPNLISHRTRKISIAFKTNKEKLSATVDGELIAVPKEITIECLPKSLSVLVSGQGHEEEAL